jgi:hypothetical protein
MKYGILKHVGFSKGDDDNRRLISMGDVLESLAIKSLYQRMGIDDSQIVECNAYDLHEYGKNGEEYVVLPINYYSITVNYSSRVLPVFLGESLGGAERSLTEGEEQIFRRFQPVGCRDERTFRMLVNKGIDAYVAGCMVASFPKRTEAQNQSADTVYFIDVFGGIKDYVPKSLLEKYVFRSHDYYLSINEMTDNGSHDIYSLGQDLIDEYAQNAKLIVTSKFHAAIIALALGIPVILILENNCFKYSWLHRFIPIYEPEDCAKIDWNPGRVVIPDAEKELMKTVAIRRIQETYQKYHDILALSELREDPSIQRFEDLFYGSGAIDYITQCWKKDIDIEYAFWGVTETAKKLQEFISSHFSNARLVRVFDFSNRTPFFDVIPEPSENIGDYPGLFVFVTSASAFESAVELFENLDKPSEEFFLCRRSILTPEDVESRI